MKIIAQIWTVMVMNIRSLPQRLWMSLAAVLAVAVVIFVLLAFLAMANGFNQTLSGTGSEDIAIVTRDGSQSELNSVISRDGVNIISTAEGIAKDKNGNPIYSAELYVVVDGIKRTTGTEVNIPLRGISSSGVSLRDQVTIIEGRMFESGKNELMIGSSALREFSGFELGREVTFGKTKWKVVGVFSTGGSVFESEVWADARTVQTQFRRGSSFQTMRMRLANTGDITALEKLIEADPRLNFNVETEAKYYAEQGNALSGIVIFGWAVSIVMGAGALAGALNTMFTSVSARTTEIATLRAIGFSNTSAFMGTLFESVVLSLIGGIAGTTLAFAALDGLSASTLSAGFTQVVFTFELSPDLFATGIKLALAIGFIGGFFPAWRAARMPVVKAFG